MLSGCHTAHHKWEPTALPEGPPVFLFGFALYENGTAKIFKKI